MTVWNGDRASSRYRGEGFADRNDPGFVVRLLIGVVLLIALLIAGRAVLIGVQEAVMHPFRTLVDSVTGRGQVNLVDPLR